MTAVVADDQPLFRAGLAGALPNHLNILAQASDGGSALGLVREHRPDLAILELTLPELDGLAVLAAIRRERLDTRVLLLATAFAEHDVRRAISLGVSGLHTKQTDAEELCQAVLAIGRGELVLDPDGLVAGVAMQVPTGLPAVVKPLTMAPSTSVSAALLRVMARPTPLERVVPVVLTDQTGRPQGVVPVERLVEAVVAGER